MTPVTTTTSGSTEAHLKALQLTTAARECEKIAVGVCDRDRATPGTSVDLVLAQVQNNGSRFMGNPPTRWRLRMNRVRYDSIHPPPARCPRNAKRHVWAEAVALHPAKK